MGHGMFAGKHHVAHAGVNLGPLHDRARDEAPQHGVAEQRTGPRPEKSLARRDGDRSDDRPRAKILERAPAAAAA